MAHINNEKIAEIRDALSVIIRQIGRIDRLLPQIKYEPKKQDEK